MAKHRSPAYPQADLGTIVALIENLYPQATKHPIGVEVLAQEWGYKSLASAAPYVAAAKYFGLLKETRSGEDRLLVLTERAKDIASDKEGKTREREEAIKKAAVSPTIFNAMWLKWGNELPPEGEIRRYLEREKEFNPKYVGRVVENYKATLKFAKFSGKDTINEEWGDESEGDDNGDESPDFAAGQFKKLQQQNGKKDKAIRMRELPVTLPSLNVAIIKVPAPMSKSDYDTLVNSLKIWEDALVAKESSGPDDDGYDEDEG